MGKDWPYSILSSQAKEAGGPESLIEEVYSEGKKDGTNAVLAAEAVAGVVAAAVYGVYRGIKYFRGKMEKTARFQQDITAELEEIISSHANQHNSDKTYNKERTCDMNKNLRKAVIAGNWKMNKTPAEAKELISAIAPLVKNAGCDVIACTPYVDLCSAQEAAQGTNIQIGAENCHWAKSGAFTGEISADMLASMGVNIVIIGHSERRQYFGETDVTVRDRTRAALDAGLTVILCVGETLEQREQGITSELVSLQTKIALGGVSAEELKRVIIAYEPVWAIGTGKTATAEQANEVCHTIRETIAQVYGQASADGITIQYGGSMNAANAAELLAQPDVDGGLIGGASLKPADFAAIVEAASK